MAGLTLTEVQEAKRGVVKEILDGQRAPGVLVRHPYRGERDDGSIARVQSVTASSTGQ
jgi:hypothetical protein